MHQPAQRPVHHHLKSCSRKAFHMVQVTEMLLGHCKCMVCVGFAFVFSVVFSMYFFGLKVEFCERVVRYFYKPLSHSSAPVVFPCSLVHVHAVALHLLFALKVSVRNSSEWPSSDKLQLIYAQGWHL